MSKWSRLANAKHIDLIIAHAKTNPKAWNAASPSAAWDAARDAAWYSAWDAAQDAAWYSAWEADWDAAAVASASAGGSLACRGAILALVVWDRASSLMDLPAEQVKVLSLLGDQAAILMYPVIVAMETTQELV